MLPVLVLVTNDCAIPISSIQEVVPTGDIPPRARVVYVRKRQYPGRPVEEAVCEVVSDMKFVEFVIQVNTLLKGVAGGIASGC